MVFVYRLPDFQQVAFKSLKQEAQKHGAAVYGPDLIPELKNAFEGKIHYLPPALPVDDQREVAIDEAKNAALIYQRGIKDKSLAGAYFIFLRKNAAEKLIVANSYFYCAPMNEASHHYTDQYLIFPVKHDRNKRKIVGWFNKLFYDVLPSDEKDLFFLKQKELTRDQCDMIERVSESIWQGQVVTRLDKIAWCEFENGSIQANDIQYLYGHLARFLPKIKEKDSGPWVAPWNYSVHETGEKKITYLSALGNELDILLLFEGFLIPDITSEPVSKGVTIRLPHSVFSYRLAKELDPPCPFTSSYFNYISHYNV